jgi:hypothetical protein
MSYLYKCIVTFLSALSTTLPLAVFSDGEVDDEHGKVTTSVADLMRQFYAIIGIGIVLTPTIAWFVWLKKKSA